MKISRTPNKERLLNALYGRVPDHIPLIELGIHPVIKKELMGKDIFSLQDEIEFMGRYCYDFVKIQPGFNMDISYRKFTPGEKSASGASSDRSWAVESQGIISTFDDLEKFPWPRISDIDFRRFDEAEKIVPDNMAVIGQYGDIFTLVWEMMGFENFAVALYTDPELIESAFNRVSELIIPMFESMAQRDKVDILWYSDDIAFVNGPMLSPEHLKQYFFPLLKRIGDIASKYNKPLIYHSDGDLRPVFEDIIDCGVTALHPIEPKAMSIFEVSDTLKGKISVCGGIDLDLLSRGEPHHVEQLVRGFAEHFKERGGWSAGSSNSIPEYVKTENYLKIIETIVKYG
ncbi:MAG: nucleoside 2-deoxyribosyltransferase [Ignavibacteriales bacterium]|nr:nucleoside 2-deoxyribosyltransferase [Ignavibacteriales bacterium]MCF8314563.1 nucleoside 2-deoxyribosyltransferase [Ignavibacteriales bacterium]MCF8436400.1 nucleoside 2-deoxyribosyltransferase [Ignavibacteriales bacterium]